MNEQVPPWYYRQSGVIPFRHMDGKTEVLLITSRKRKNWIIPKGVVEPELTPQASASKEAHEEAGITGEVLDKPVGVMRQEKWGGTCRIEVFPLEVRRVMAIWPESYLRSRQWFSVGEALERVNSGEIKRMLQAFAEQLPNILEKS